MATKKPAQTKPKANEVDDFMHALDHPLKKELQAIRVLILGADPSIAEGIKWNSPSFRTDEYFATTNMRSKDVVQVIMHFGAKVTEHATKGAKIEDPAGLLQWLAKDRASVKFHDMKEIKVHGDAFADIVRQWIAQMR